MRFYHTSNVIVSKPDVHHSRKHLDFGMGFYLTALDQLRWKQPDHQLCITSQQVIDRYLQFVESITL
jgi:hypothetical protein